MRNLKKVLALALALVMTLSVLSIATAAFTDEEDINPAYEEAVDVLAALGVFQGRDDGSFDPQATITRAEVAAIIYRISTGDVNDEQVGLYADYNKFEDVTSDKWFAGYVNYCANATYIKGRSDTIFDPDADVTGYEVLAMILRVVGYDQNDEWTGSGWEIKVASTANELGVTAGITGTTLGSAVSREVVAQMLFKAIQVPCVTYTPALGYSQYTSMLSTVKNDSVGYKTFKLLPDTYTDVDDWGRPVKEWKLDTNASGRYYKVADEKDATLLACEYNPVLLFETAEDECDISEALGITKKASVEAIYVNAIKADEEEQDAILNGDNAITPTQTTKTIGEQGRLTAIYEVDGEYWIVMIDEFLAEVKSVTELKYDKNGHVSSDATLTLTVYDKSEGGSTEVKLTSDTNWEYAKGDMLIGCFETTSVSSSIVEKTPSVYAIMGIADSITGKQTVVDSDDSTRTIEDTEYTGAYEFNLDQAGYDTDADYIWYFDSYGNLIGSKAIKSSTEAAEYGVITSIYWKDSSDGEDGYAVAKITYMDATTTENYVKIASIDGYGLYEGSVALYTADPTELEQVAKEAAELEEAGAEFYWIVTDTISTNKDAYANQALYKITNSKDGLVLTSQTLLDEAAITNGTATIESGVAVATTKTVYLVYDNDVYASYTSYKNVPSYDGVTVWVETKDDDDNSVYVQYVFVKGTASASTTVMTYYVSANANLSWSYNPSTKEVTIYGGYVNGVQAPLTVSVEKQSDAQEIVNLISNEYAGKLLVITLTDGEIVEIIDVAAESAPVDVNRNKAYYLGELGVDVTYGNGGVLTVGDQSYLIADATVIGSSSFEEGYVYVVYSNGTGDLNVSYVYVSTADPDVIETLTITDASYDEDTQKFEVIFETVIPVEVGTAYEITITDSEGTTVASTHSTLSGSAAASYIVAHVSATAEIATDTYTATVKVAGYEADSYEFDVTVTEVEPEPDPEPNTSPITLNDMTYDTTNTQFVIDATLAEGVEIQNGASLTVVITLNGAEFIPSGSFTATSDITAGDFEITVSATGLTVTSGTYEATVTIDGTDYDAVTAQFELIVATN